MDLANMTFENWLGVMAMLSGIVGAFTAYQSRSIKQTIKAEVSAPLATLEANHTNLCEKLESQGADSHARAEMHARRIEDTQRDIRDISGRLMAVETVQRYYPPRAANG